MPQLSGVAHHLVREATLSPELPTRPVPLAAWLGRVLMAEHQGMSFGDKSSQRRVRLHVAARTVPDVRFSRIRFLGCTRVRGAKQSLQAHTRRRLTSVIQGRALLTRSRPRVHCSQV